MSSLPRDANRIAVIGGVSSTDGVTPVPPYVDPTTHRLLVDLPQSSLTLETNGVANGSQVLLNLVAGTNITLTDNGSGSVTVASSSGGSGITRSINVISTPTTAGATAATDYVYLVSGTTTLTLPTAVGNTNLYTIKNSGVATVTISTTSVQTIDGSASASLTPNTSLSLISNNSNWFVI